MTVAAAAEPRGAGRDRGIVSRPFVLPSDVLVFPVTELAEGVRAELDCEDWDFAVTRPGSIPNCAITSRALAALMVITRAARRAVKLTKRV